MSGVLHWLDRQPEGPWWALLREAIEEYGLETSGAELPIGHCLEWLAEWGREARRRQTGLLLLSAHRAKGLEFDHVAVLDGDWDRIGAHEDRDAPRRLYYVAMTRARKGLILAHFDRGHGLLDSLPAMPSLLHRSPASLPSPAPELARRYRRLTLREVDLGFAGRHGPDDPVHHAIATLTAGDRLELRRERDRWLLVKGADHIAGRLAHAFAPPVGMQCTRARVAAIVVRRREDGEGNYRNSARCERWEVVVPDLVFAPRAPRAWSRLRSSDGRDEREW